MKKFVTLAVLFMVVAASAQQNLSRLRSRNTRSTRPAATQPAPAAPAADEAASADSSGAASDLNFNQTPVDLVFETYSRMVGKTILKDPQVPAATITLKSESGQKLTESEQLEAIEIVLEMNGIHLEPYGEKFIRALPRKDVRKEGIPLIMDPETKLGETGRVVSMMIPFKNISTEEAQKALEGFKSNSGILLVFERTNSILVTDTEQNINRMIEIAKAIDVASPVTEVVEYIQIKNANANDIKTVIDNIVQESMKEQEKNGKQPQNNNAPAQNNLLNRPAVGGLLRRPGQQQNNNNQPAAPVNNQSLVMTVSDADRGMIRGKVVTIADERSNKILLITSASNMKFFKEVIAALDVETTPDTVVKVYRLKYAEAEDVSDMINDLIGNSSSSKTSGKANQNQNAKQGTSGSVTRGNQTQQVAKKPANQRSGEAKAGELNKDNTTVLADKRINGLVVMTNKDLVPTIEQIIESMDVKLSQVLIETAIIEVTLGDDLKTGVDWVRLGDKQKVTTQTPKLDAQGNPLFYVRKTVTEGNGASSTTLSDELTQMMKPAGYNETVARYDENDNVIGHTTYKADSSAGVFDYVTDWVRGGLWNNDGKAFTSMLGAGGGDAANILNNIVGLASTNASEVASLLSPAGSGINLFLKSDTLNLGAVIKASKSDNRAKYIASPVVMTVDNKEAQIEATESRKFFNGYETSSGYNYVRTPKYDDKEIGIKIKVTPKINPNGTVMLELEEEYSQLGAGQSIIVDNGTANIDTALTRKMSADILLDNMQSVVLGGLTETFTQDKETGIPILKDIPIIGKWLFGSVSQVESRKELLVFMTPYVLNDSESAQVEALRRKKALSDPNPWEDHGWSLSNLADPVSKKEQMRRIKDEWKRQDEERKTKIAIEKMKVDRAKALQKMSAEERKLWLEMHKEELEKEEKEELEKKMLDKDSQEELRKLAEQVKAKKLADADKEIKKMEELTHSENERGKLDAEKAKAEQAKSEKQD